MSSPTRNPSRRNSNSPSPARGSEDALGSPLARLKTVPSSTSIPFVVARPWLADRLPCWLTDKPRFLHKAGRAESVREPAMQRVETAQRLTHFLWWKIAQLNKSANRRAKGAKKNHIPTPHLAFSVGCVHEMGVYTTEERLVTSLEQRLGPRGPRG